MEWPTKPVQTAEANGSCGIGFQEMSRCASIIAHCHRYTCTLIIAHCHRYHCTLIIARALPPVSLYIITSTLQTKLNIDHCLQGTLQDLIDGAHWNWHPQIRHCTSLYITHKTLLPDLAGKTNATSLFQQMNMQVIHKTKSTPPPPLNPISMSSPPSPLCSHPTPPFWSPAFASADSTNRPLASEALCRNISGGHSLNITPPSGQNPLVKRTTSVDQSCLYSCRSFPYSQNVRTFWFGNL